MSSHGKGDTPGRYSGNSDLMPCHTTLKPETLPPGLWLLQERWIRNVHTRTLYTNTHALKFLVAMINLTHLVSIEVGMSMMHVLL